MKRCPLCRQEWTPRRPQSKMLRKLERIGDEWTTVADGADRTYRRKLERRYPGWEFRHERVSLLGEFWRVEARRLQKGGKPCLKIVPGS